MATKSIYKRALKVASNSKHDKHRMAAVVVKGGSVLSQATNGEADIHGPLRSSRHAEQRALKPHAACYEGAVLVVAREGNKMSKPCAKCLALAKSCGIKKIIYADWEGNITIEKI